MPVTIEVRKYSNDLTIKLDANETLEFRSSNGRILLRVTMAADSASVDVQTIPITQYEADTDIGNTGWIVT